MIGLGTLINTAAIVAGGIFGLLFGNLINERIQDTLTKACGLSVLFLGISGALPGMMKEDKSMFVVLCIVIGALIGEALNIEGGLERFGEWLKVKSGNAKDQNFVNGFLTASLTVCIGAMGILGSLNDGISGDWTLLAAKGVLDFIIVMVMTCTLGKGCIFSAVPILIYQGGITVLASFLKPYMTDAALANISLIGSILIFGIGVNLVWGKKIRVANLLPAIILAVIAAFLGY